MPKKPDLAKLAIEMQQVGRVRRGVVSPGDLPPAEPRTTGKPSRQGTVGLTVHVAPEVRRQLKMLALENDLTVHQAVCAALNLLFAQHRRPEIAQ